jgi:hypothetical protein
LNICNLCAISVDKYRLISEFSGSPKDETFDYIGFNFSGTGHQNPNLISMAPSIKDVSRKTRTSENIEMLKC